MKVILQGALINQKQKIRSRKQILLKEIKDWALFQNNLHPFISINKYQVMSSKGWKYNMDSHKTTTSLIFNDYQIKPNSNMQPATYPHKHHHDQTHKNQIFYRHSSQEDFKKKNPISNQLPQNTPQIRIEEEYFVRTPSNNSQKTGKSSQQSEKEKYVISKPFAKEKSHLDRVTQKNNFLKETASTQSAENLKIINKIVPPFVRARPSKKLTSMQEEFENSKVCTSRTRLRRENFRIFSKLGEGKFGKVFLVKDVNTGFILAMKIIEKRKIIQENLLEQFIRQLKIQSFLNHPNIISLYGFFHDETHFYTLMELGCDGQLYSLMSDHKNLNEETTSFIIKNLLEAIHYMHGNKILHRDIKPENIVLIMGSLKMCDFGWAVNKLHPGQLRNTFCGTPLYLSPQLLNGHSYDEKVDIWAIGVLAYELIVGKSPFDIVDQEDLHKIITKDVLFPKDVETSAEFEEFIMWMLSKDPNKRMTSKKLLQLEFIKKYEQFQTCQQLCK